MLKYRVNVNNVNKTKVVLPVSSIEFTDFSELSYEENGNTEYVEYDGFNKNKILVTCECENVDNLKVGGSIECVNRLILEDKTYEFNDKYEITGVNKEDISFSFLFDKYYTFKVAGIYLDKSDDGNEYNTIRFYVKDGHYFDKNDNLTKVANEEFVQKLPIYFSYTDNEGKLVVRTVNFKSDTYNTLLTTKSEFENCKDLFNMLFGSNAYESINDDMAESIDGNLSGIEVYRDTFLFGERCSYFFQHERSVVNIPIALSNSFETNLQQSYLVQEQFVDEEKKKAINRIVDLEKDVYYPFIKKVDEKTKKVTLTEVYTIKFNLHFREHRGDNWLPDKNCLWNGVRQENNTIYVDENITDDNVSDLLTYLDFTNDDVHYQKNKLKKSFLRLSFYDSTNPANQNLLCYHTIFLDSGELFAKYIRYFETENCVVINQDLNQYGKYTIPTDDKKKYKTGIRVNREPPTKFDETIRLSSQFVVKSKNTSKASSEGFYLYLWKDNESAVPQDIYMKVEFNHAGYGRTLPFMMPYWDKKKWANTEQNTKQGIKTFSEIINDWKATKTVDDDGNVTWSYGDGHYGIRQYIKYSYIHLKYQYDKDRDKHIYYFDTDTYGNIDFPKGDDGNQELVINLYEAKVE